MKRTIIYCILISVLTWAHLQGQNPKFVRAEKFFEKEAYPFAARLYEKAFSSGAKKDDAEGQIAMEHLAECYAKVDDYTRAEAWYTQAGQRSQSPEVFLAYGHVLKSNGKYQEATNAYIRYGELTKDFVRTRSMIEACEKALEIRENGAGWTIRPTSLSSKNSDFGPVMRGSEIVFASARKRGFWVKFLNMRNENMFYDLYAAPQNSATDYDKVKLQRGALRTHFHDGPVVFSRDASKAYLTRSNQKSGRLRRDSTHRAHLTLYESELKGKKYRRATPMPFTSEQFSTGHPALSGDGKLLIFSSDRPGGVGGSDLYMTNCYNGKWSEPENLGRFVNTPGDEMFPFLLDDGTLVFSSNGHDGLGGLDLFSAQQAEVGFLDVTNLGAPLNSPQDDFSMVVTRGGRGYFSSNRNGGKGSDDIYFFQRLFPATILVRNEQSGEPIEGASLRILSSTGAAITGMTDADGKFLFPGEWNREYMLYVEKPDHNSVTQKFGSGDKFGWVPNEVKVELRKELILTVAGKTVETGSGKKMAGVNVVLNGERHESKIQSDEQGEFAGRLDALSDYTVIASQTGYVPAIQQFSTREYDQATEIPVNLSMHPGKFLIVQGQTVDNTSGQPVGGASLRVFEEGSNRILKTMRTRSDGKFWLVLEEGQNLDLIGTANGYFSSRMKLPDFDQPGDSVMQARLEMVPFELGALVKVIYYPYRQSDLVRNARQDLNEIVSFLLDNPAASVELSSFTDSRGSEAANQTLSEARAKSAVDYIVARGIDRSRIKAAGYGESRPINECKDGVECSEEAHHLNRRTEINVVKIEGK